MDCDHRAAVSDAVSQVQVAVLGAGPALAAGMMQISGAAAVGLSLQNAVFNQQLLIGQQQTLALTSLRLLRDRLGLGRLRPTRSRPSQLPPSRPSQVSASAVTKMLVLHALSNGKLAT